MSMQLFDELVSDVPPSTVDVDGIVRREKRRRAARRATGFATAVVALSVTAAVGLTMAGGTGASSPPPVAGDSSASVAVDTRFALVGDSEESIDATARRLSKALDAALKKAAPDAEWIFEPNLPGQTGPDGQPLELSHKAALDGKKSDEMFAGSSGFRNGGRKGSMHFIIFDSVGRVEGGPPTKEVVKCSRVARECVEGTTSTGAKTAVHKNDFGDGAIGYNAKVELPDGRILELSQSNDFGPDGAGAAQPGTALTADQTLAVAVDVASQIKAA